MTSSISAISNANNCRSSKLDEKDEVYHARQSPRLPDQALATGGRTNELCLGLTSKI